MIDKMVGTRPEKRGRGVTQKSGIRKVMMGEVRKGWVPYKENKLCLRKVLRGATWFTCQKDSGTSKGRGRVRGVGREAICESPRRPKACVRGGGCQICAPFPHPPPDLYLHCAAAARCPALSSPGISNFSPRSHSLTTASEPARPLTPPAGRALDLILIPAPCVFPWHCLPPTRLPTSRPPDHGTGIMFVFSCQHPQLLGPRASCFAHQAEPGISRHLSPPSSASLQAPVGRKPPHMTPRVSRWLHTVSGLLSPNLFQTRSLSSSSPWRNPGCAGADFSDCVSI